MNPQPIQRTRNRFDDALFVQAGACNGQAVARALVKAYDEAKADTRSTGDANLDPAVQMILHQLCHLGGIITEDSSRFVYEAAYRECVDRCQSYRTLVLTGDIDTACIFVCDTPHYDVRNPG